MNQMDRQLHLFAHRNYPTGYVSPEHEQALCCVQSCGKFVCMADYQTDRIGYDAYLMLYVLAGQCRLHYRDAEYMLGVGEAFLIDCREHQIYGANPEDPCTFVYVHFRGGNTPYLFERLARERGVVFQGMAAGIISSVMVQIQRISETAVDRYMVERMAAIMYQTLLRLLSCESQQQSVYDRAAHFVREMIAKGQRVSVQDMADYVGYSRCHFTRAFSQVFHIAPYEYILRERLARCKDLLLNTDQSISAIALECGYTDASHLTNCFTQRMNVSPARYRKQMRLFD